MKKTLAKGMACLAFGLATVMPVAAQTLPPGFETRCKGPQHPLNPFNQRALTKGEKTTCYLVGGGIAALAVAGGYALTRRRKH